MGSRRGRRTTALTGLLFAGIVAVQVAAGCSGALGSRVLHVSVATVRIDGRPTETLRFGGIGPRPLVSSDVVALLHPPV